MTLLSMGVATKEQVPMQDKILMEVPTALREKAPVILVVRSPFLVMTTDMAMVSLMVETA